MKSQENQTAEAASKEVSKFGQHPLQAKGLNSVDPGQSMPPVALQLQSSPIQRKEASEEEDKQSLQLKTEVSQLASHDDGCDCGTCAADIAQAKAEAPIQQKAHDDGCACPDCGSTAQMKTAPMQLQTGVIQMVRPSNIVSMTFCGVSIPVSRGLHPTMKAKLELVQTELQTKYDAIAAGPDKPATLKDYAGLESIKGWRETTSKHGTGSAVDVNYAKQPYIATRTTEGTTTTYGGENGGATRATRALREPAVDVYDRATSFMLIQNMDAEVGNRETGETATHTYQRFRVASDSLSSYLSLVFLNGHDSVRRRPIANPETASKADLLAAIPTTERKTEAVATAEIQAVLDSLWWSLRHPGYSKTAEETFTQIMRDYEIVRRPMQNGNPTTSPSRTRNPANGFLHMPEHFVVAMMDIGGLRWGACEFSGRSNGDVHHFDLGTPHSIAPPTPPAPAAAAPAEGGTE